MLGASTLLVVSPRVEVRLDRKRVLEGASFELAIRFPPDAHLNRKHDCLVLRFDLGWPVAVVCVRSGYRQAWVLPWLVSHTGACFECQDGMAE